MADLTMRDAARVERDRQLQFSQFGASLRLRLYDREGEMLREVKAYWNRYRKTTRENAVYYQFKIADLKSEFESDMKKVGDSGSLGVFISNTQEPKYNVNRVDGFEAGESRIWTVSTDSTSSTKAALFSRP